MSLFLEMARMAEQGLTFVVATVVSSSGSAPQKAGAKLLVLPGGRLSGTIGGGAIEKQVVEAARELLADGGAATRLFDVQLAQDLGMSCGGRMAVFLEKVRPQERVYLFGAGHVAKALYGVTQAAGFSVTVADAREEWLTEERFPKAERALGDPVAFARAAPFDGAGALACVLTHDHALDQELVEVLLRQPLRYLGMIGSLRKGEKVRARLAERDFSPETIARLRTPMGVSIGALTPEEIAVSIAAELIAVRRGLGPAPAAPGVGSAQ
jgi:xanthine dehydrogenase accessory factor